MITAPAGFATANEELVKTPIVLIEIEGYARSFTNQTTGISGQYPWIEAIQDLTVTVSGSDLDGGADQAQFVFSVQDRGRLLTADMPGFVFEGKKVTLKTGFVGMDQADFAILFTGVIDHIDIAGGQSYVFNCVDNKELLNEVVYQTGDDGFPTDSDHPHTLSAHPLDILLDILTVQVGLDPSLVDVAGIEDYRDNVFGGLQFTFLLTSAPTAKDFIEQELLKPLGGYLWTNNLGQFRVNFFYHLSASPVLTVTEDDTIGVPDATQADLINTVTVRFDKGGGDISTTNSSLDNSDKFMAEDVEEFGTSISKYGQVGQQIIESQGMRSSLQGYSQARLLARWIFLRYGFKNTQLDEVEMLWNKCLLEPGDIIGLTNEYIPVRETGVVGMSNKLFEVMDRTYDFTRYVVKFGLLDASFLSSAFGGGYLGPPLISGDAEADYTVASPTDQAKYLFLCNNSDQYSNGDAARRLG